MEGKLRLEEKNGDGTDESTTHELADGISSLRQSFFEPAIIIQNVLEKGNSILSEHRDWLTDFPLNYVDPTSASSPYIPSATSSTDSITSDIPPASITAPSSSLVKRQAATCAGASAASASATSAIASATSSADSVISSVSSSAALALSKASVSVTSAIASASLSASSAISAAQSSASSVMSLASQSIQEAQSEASAARALASADVSDSQTQATTSTRIAIAIVGAIIGSVLLVGTVVLIISCRRRASRSKAQPKVVETFYDADGAKRARSLSRSSQQIPRSRSVNRARSASRGRTLTAQPRYNERYNVAPPIPQFPRDNTMEMRGGAGSIIDVPPSSREIRRTTKGAVLEYDSDYPNRAPTFRTYMDGNLRSPGSSDGSVVILPGRNIRRMKSRGQILGEQVKNGGSAASFYDDEYNTDEDRRQGGWIGTAR